MMQKLNTRTPIAFRIALVLFCLVLFSTYLTGGLYARYTTSASDSDSARVAVFRITGSNSWEQGTEVDLNLSFFDPNLASDTLRFSISSQSEVAVTYSLEIEMPELDDNGNEVNYQWLTVKLDSGAPITAVGNKFQIANIGAFAPNQTGEHEHTLTFSIGDDYMGLPNVVGDVTGKVSITLRAEQID